MVVQLSTFFWSDDTRTMVESLYGHNNYRRLLLEDAWFAERLTRQRGNEWRLGYHYTWFEEGDQGFNLQAHCPNGICSVAAVLASERILMNPNASRNQQLNAFRFLIHYMGDLHDPMNAGFAADRGGREIEVVASNLERLSLHEIWQERVFDHLPHDPFVMANLWARSIPDNQRQQWQRGEPASWVWETHELARDMAYPLIESADGWNAIYRREAMPALEEQIKKAAVRLAFRLNMVAASRAGEMPSTGSGADLPETEGSPDLLEFN